MAVSLDRRANAAPVQRGILRRLAGMLFYLISAFGAMLSIATAMTVRALHHRHSTVGDFAGADMALWFLLDELAPLTILALIVGVWLVPPSQWIRRRNRLEDRDLESAPHTHRIFATVITVAGLGLLVFVARQLTESVIESHGFFDAGTRELVGVVLRDLVVFSPMILLAIALFISARKLARTPR